MPTASTTDWQPISAPAPAPVSSSGPTASASATSTEADWQPIGSTASAQLPQATSNTPSLADIGQGLVHAFGSAVQTAKTAAEGGVDEIKQGVQQIEQPGASPANIPEGALKIGGGIVDAAASPLAPVITPLASPIVSKAADAISNTTPFKEYGEDPTANTNDLPTRIATDVSNASKVAGGVVGGAEGLDAAPQASDVLSTLKTAAQAANDKVADTISPFKTTSSLKTEATENINKALGNTGKASATGLLNKDANRLSGVETLYTLTKDQPITRPDGTTFQFDPTNITNPQDLLSAFVQAKNQLWSRVADGLQRGSSIKPNYAPVIDQLKDVVDNSADPSLVAHAQSRLGSIAKLQTQGVQGAQRFLQETLGPRVGAAVTGASDAPAVKLDLSLYNGVSNALDDGLSKVQDGSIRPYKNMYSSLKSIEPDIVRMTQQTLRARGGGVPQYINDYGNINLLEAAFAHNPALYVAKGLATKVLSKVLSTQRDPLDHLSKAFQAVQGYLGNAKPPQESPVLALPPGNPGAPSQVSSGPAMSLPARAPSTVDAQEMSRIQAQLPPGNQ